LLSELELRNLIEMEKDKNQYIIDREACERHRQFILGLECVLND